MSEPRGDAPAGVRRLEGVATISIDADDILHIVFEQGVLVDLSTARRGVALHVESAAGRKRPALVDLRGLRGVSLPARKLVAGPDVAEITERMALLTGDRVSAVLGNFFLRVSRPAYPTRLFSDLEAALRWLREGADAKEDG